MAMPAGSRGAENMIATAREVHLKALRCVSANSTAVSRRERIINDEIRQILIYVWHKRKASGILVESKS